jgi:diguanylate cyclase (GGDEF)-like protein
MLVLDIQTTVFLTALSAILMSSGMYMTMKSYSAVVGGVRRWTIACSIQAVGWSIIIFSRQLPDAIPALLGNSLILLSTAYYYHALSEFTNLRARMEMPYAIVGVAFTGLAYFTFIQPQHGLRTAVFSGAYAVLALMCATVLLYQQKRHRTVGQTLCGFGFLLGAVVLALRAGYVTLLPQTATSVFTRGLIQYCTFTSMYMIVVILTFGFMLMCNEQFNAELEKMARTDALTGCMNRRTVLDALRAEILRARRANHTLSLLLLDLDHFKSINDTYGHIVGDAVLKTVVPAMRDQLRAGDFLGRYGGEEFLVVLPETGEIDAVAAASRLRSAVEQTTIYAQSTSLNATMSVGVATLGVGDDSLESVIHRADLALYKAKEMGRNRVVASSDLISMA